MAISFVIAKGFYGVHAATEVTSRTNWLWISLIYKGKVAVAGARILLVMPVGVKPVLQLPMANLLKTSV